jgi:hypothetical protein
LTVVERIALLALLVAAAACSGSSSTPGDGGTPGGYGPAAGCIEIDLPSGRFQDWNLADYIGVTRTEAGLHVFRRADAWRAPGTVNPPRNQAIVHQQFDPGSGVQTGLRIHDLGGNEGQLGLNAPMSMAPDGTFAVSGFWATFGRPVMERPDLMIGRLSDDPLLHVRDGPRGGVSWDGEAFAIHHYVGPEFLVSRTRLDGSTLSPTLYAPALAPDPQRQLLADRARATDPITGKTMLVIANGGPLLLAGHQRDGSPMFDPHLFVTVAGTEIAAAPDIAPLEDGAWIFWIARTKDSKLDPGVPRVARIGLDGQLLGPPIDVTDIPTAADPVTAGRLVSARAGSVRLVVVQKTSFQLDRHSIIDIAAGAVVQRRVFADTYLAYPTLTVWGDEIWMHFAQAVQVGPNQTGSVVRVLKVQGECRYGVAPPPAR